MSSGQFLPLVSLILFFASESFLKKGISLPVQLFCLLPLLISAGFLFQQFRQMSEDPWNNSDEFDFPSWSVFAIVVLAGLFRFWKLGSLFEGLGWDEAYKGLDAVAISEFGDRPVFLGWNAGRDALVAYLIAITQYFAGHTPFTVRFVSALAGTLSVLFLYLFARELFGRRIAWISAFLLAVSKWHIVHSRYAVRTPLFPLFELAALFLIVRALRSDRPKLLLFAGVVTWIGFYSYTAYRIFPLILACLLLDKGLRSQAVKYWKYVLGATIVCAAVVLPLAAFTIQNADIVFDRVGRTAVWNESADKHPVTNLLNSVAATVGMFTFSGDPIIKHNVDGDPMLSIFLCGVFLLGLIVLLSRAKPFAIFLLAYLGLSLLPGFLTVQAPQASRTLGAVPPAMLISAIGLMSAGQIIYNLSRISWRIFVMVILPANLLIGPQHALLRYGEILDSLSPMESSQSGLDRHQHQVATLLNQMGERCEMYLSPQLFFHSTIAYLTYKKSYPKLFSQYTKFEPASRDGKIAMVVLVLEDSNLWWLRDEDGKNFFKWWTQVHSIQPENARALIQRTYISHPRMMSTSDNRLLYMLQTRYPAGRLLHPGTFSVFIVGKVKEESRP